MDNLTQHIQSPQHITKDDVTSLDSLLHEFPYFQTAQLLLVKGLLNTDSIRYNQQLKKTASYSLNRKQLFKLITQHRADLKSIIIENIDKVSVMHITGGEPLQLPKHWEMLNRIPDEYAKQIELHYDTNFTKLQYKNQKSATIFQKKQICQKL